MSFPPIAALDIGTTNTVALIGELDENQNLTITGRGIYPSTGMRKGQIIDIEQAKVGINRVVEKAADESQVDIGSLLLSVGGGSIQGVSNHGTVPVRSSGQIVGREDIDEAREIARTVNLPSDCEVIHQINQNFTLDDVQGIMKPLGLHGSRLTLNMLTIHGLRTQIETLRQLVRSVELNVSSMAFSGLCSALAMLTSEQKRAGAAVIDLGGGTTDYLVYADNVIAAAGSLGVGGDHITNDLALAFNLPNASAEKLKLRHGQAIVKSGVANKRLTIPQELGFEERTVSLRAFHVVINARQAETLRLVCKRLIAEDLLPRLGAGVILTGGCAAMPGILELAQSIFRIPCQVGVPATSNLTGLEDVQNPAAYATAAGLVIYGQKIAEETSLIRPVQDFMKRVFKQWTRKKPT